jgi:peptide/nickel transport system ATP-binding protein
VKSVGDKWEQDVAMSDIEEKEYAITYCKFAPRCAYATDECMKERPPVKDLGGGRKVMCFNPLNQA